MGLKCNCHVKSKHVLSQSESNARSRDTTCAAFKRQTGELSKLDKRLVPGEIHHFNLNMICQETGQVKCVLKDSV